MSCLKNRVHHIIAQRFPARENRCFHRTMFAGPVGRYLATLLPMFVPGFQQTGEKGCGKMLGDEGNHTPFRPFHALHCIECEDEFFVKIYVACLMDAARRGEIHRILPFA
jgi:hypothetical protein